MRIEAKLFSLVLLHSLILLNTVNNHLDMLDLVERISMVD
jgi:hypothetical protein